VATAVTVALAVTVVTVVAVTAATVVVIVASAVTAPLVLSKSRLGKAAAKAKANSLSNNKITSNSHERYEETGCWQLEDAR
jgi:hypothetical protein